jgi:hypothetical protein
MHGGREAFQNPQKHIQCAFRDHPIITHNHKYQDALIVRLILVIFVEVSALLVEVAASHRVPVCLRSPELYRESDFNCEYSFEIVLN